jgi:hypothetical protein
MSTCARNLPQHFNGCTCSTAPGGVTTEVSDVTLTDPAVVPGKPLALGEEWVSARDLSGGMVVLVDGEQRTVDASWPVSSTEVGVEFESYDREPDGTPSAYLFRTFGIDEHFRTPVPGEAIAEVTEYANDYCVRARGARPGICHPLAWNIRDQFGWEIVQGRRDDLPHFWNAMPDGRYFDGSAGMFDDEDWPLVTHADDHRYQVKDDERETTVAP